MRAALSAESLPATPPGRRSLRSPCRRFSALVRSATRSSRLSESGRSTSESASGSTGASLSLREAASASEVGQGSFKYHSIGGYAAPSKPC